MLYRPLWLLTSTIVVALLLMLGLLLYSSWRYVEQLEPVRAHLQYLAVFESTGEQINELLTQALAPYESVDEARLEAVRENLAYLRAQTALAPNTTEWLRSGAEAVTPLGPRPADSLGEARAALRQAHFDEMMAHEAVVRDAAREAARDSRTATGLALVLVLATLPLLIVLRNRVLVPLNNLSYLMRLLARQDYSSAPTSGVDPVLRPLFENYNHMVNRLMELEAQHEDREQLLQDEVNTATRMLLQQQRRLARSERLAAVGEVAASVAHELRNPLAGVQMALANLRRDMQDPDAVERIDMVLGEMRRINQQLNDLLRQAAQDPELSSDVDVRTTVEQIVALVAPQFGERLRIRNEVPRDLRCRLPEGGLRQALLNLIQNAAQAVGDEPGEVRITAQHENGQLGLTIFDSGPGFPQPLLDAGVRAFASWRAGGTGLGLATVQRFVRDLGGGIELRNVDGGGACVTLTLPVRECNG